MRVVTAAQSRIGLRSVLLAALLLPMVAVLTGREGGAAPDVLVASVSLGGRHTFAATTAGGLKCWGWNIYGQLGDGTNTGPQQCSGDACSTTAVDVSGLTSGVAAISAGYGDTCALTTAGAAMCWGTNGHAQLGDGTLSDRTAPVSVLGLTSGVAAISAGWEHSCALTTAGGVKCWGENDAGQLGDGTTTQRLTPVNVSGLTSGVAAIAAGGEYTCALTTAGGVKCWGGNGWGQLGIGASGGTHPLPLDVSGLTSGVAAISAGSSHTCAIITGGGVKCWGVNEYGQLGDGAGGGPEQCSGEPCSTTAVDVSGLGSGVATISAGGSHTCARTTGGGLKCWGFNEYGQLGDGTTTTRLTPVNVSGLTSGVAGISAGGYQTCALTTAGGIKCWGENGAGQLGIGASDGNPHPSPLDVSGLTSGVAGISVGVNHTCALASPPVGGIADMPEAMAGSTNSPALPYAAFAGIAAGGVVGVAACGWFARRRRAR